MELDEIIKGCTRNEYKAQKLLFKKYGNILMGICMRYCQSKDEAEDVLLTGFYRIYRSIDKYKEGGSFESWIKRIIINVAIDNYRKNKKYYYHDKIEDFENIHQQDEPQYGSFDVEVILKTVNELPVGYRMVFNLFTLEGYSHKEIAKMLDITINTSKTQLRKAKLSLQKKLIYLNSNNTNIKLK